MLYRFSRVSSLLVRLGILLACTPGFGAEWGLRAGVAVPIIAAHESHSFMLTELFAYMPLLQPHGWELGLEASAGALLRHTTTGMLVSLTPTARFRLSDALALHVQGGIAYQGRSRYERLDLGGPLFFRPTLGVHYALSPTVRVEGTWIHFSNAGVYQDNPGLDMLTVGVRWAW